jgi:hypothetical protein
LRVALLCGPNEIAVRIPQKDCVEGLVSRGCHLIEIASVDIQRGRAGSLGRGRPAFFSRPVKIRELKTMRRLSSFITANRKLRRGVLTSTVEPPDSETPFACPKFRPAWVAIAFLPHRDALAFFAASSRASSARAALRRFRIA